jgi:hypothetical protein
MAVSAGDHVIVEVKNVNGSERAGTVERVLAESPPRYLVRWDNGGESIILPAAGELRVVAKAPPARRSGRRGRTSDRGSGRRQT